jgi:hypothetical protein
MSRLLSGLIVVLTASSFFSSSVYAGSMTCGSHIIVDGGRSGPGKYEVLKKCGSPTMRRGNTWVYEKQGKQRKVLHFNDNGLLTTIN